MSSAVKAVVSPVAKVLGGGGGGGAPAPVPDAPVPAAVAAPVADTGSTAVLKREDKRRQAGAAAGVTRLGGATPRSGGVSSRELLG